MIKPALAATLVVLTFVACSTPPPTGEEEFSKLSLEAEKEIRAADQLGFLWRDTEKLLDDARTARKQNRHDEAMKLAQKALEQAKLAQQQAQANANAGPSFPSP
jgi:hypothetical protein